MGNPQVAEALALAAGHLSNLLELLSGVSWFLGDLEKKREKTSGPSLPCGPNETKHTALSCLPVLSERAQRLFLALDVFVVHGCH